MIEGPGAGAPRILLRRGRQLEAVTLAWNVVGVVVLTYAAICARSVALAGFALDSVIEIGASTVVLWELAGVEAARRQRAMRLIGLSFVALAIYLALQSSVVLSSDVRAHHSPLGITWTALTALVMFALADGKSRTGAQLGNPVLVAEGRITAIDGCLATAVLVALVLNTFLAWWWADPVAGVVLFVYALKEAWSSLKK